jgi:hypothetical protein
LVCSSKAGLLLLLSRSLHGDGRLGSTFFQLLACDAMVSSSVSLFLAVRWTSEWKLTLWVLDRDAMLRDLLRHLRSVVPKISPVRMRCKD